MDNDISRSVGFHAPPQHLHTPSASSLTMASWVDAPVSSAMEVDHAHACLLSQTWSEQSIFQSALSSLVSSPATTTETISGENSLMIGELIGKLSSFGNSSGEFLPSSSSSCYSTPLNSPPKLGLPAMMPSPAARFSCFGNRGLENRATPIFSTNGKVPRGENIPCKESAVSQQFSRKRKSVTKGKVRESSVGDLVSTNPKKDGEVDTNCPNPKRNRSKDKKTNKNAEEEEKQSKIDNNAKPPEPEPEKDYIHVRARRGQATDSHSLAERVRREKISERMKLLQNLVPSCNKVTGKALMLDEIINYVQSLQRQVEFLSMKLASVHTRLDTNMDSQVSNNVIEANNSSQSQVFQYDSSATQQRFDHSALLPSHLPPPSQQSSQNTPQYPTIFCEDDLQAIVQMGFGYRQNFHGRDQGPQTRTNP